MEFKEEQQKIFNQQIVVIILDIIGIILLFISASLNNAIGFMFSSLLVLFTIIYMVKLKRLLNNIQKELSDLYPSAFYNVKEPTYLEICNYLKANDFTYFEKEEVIFAVKYLETKSRIYTNHNLLGVMFLLKDDNASVIENKYRSEIKRFIQEVNRKYNIRNKKVNAINMNLFFTELEQIKIDKDNLVDLKVIYDKKKQTLYYSSYIRHFDFQIGDIIYKEIDRCISSLFKI